MIGLAEYFVKKYAAANGVAARPLSAEARRTLTLNYWPGNVRELENTMHRAVLMASGDEIGSEAILTPDGRTAYVANAQSNSVSVVDIKSMKEVTRIAVGQVPKRNITAVLP